MCVKLFKKFQSGFQEKCLKLSLILKKFCRWIRGVGWLTKNKMESQILWQCPFKYTSLSIVKSTVLCQDLPYLLYYLYFVIRSLFLILFSISQCISFVLYCIYLFLSLSFVLSLYLSLSIFRSLYLYLSVFYPSPDRGGRNIAPPVLKIYPHRWHFPPAQIYRLERNPSQKQI